MVRRGGERGQAGQEPGQKEVWLHPTRLKDCRSGAGGRRQEEQEQESCVRREQGSEGRHLGVGHVGSVV